MKDRNAAESFFKLMNFGTFFYKNYLTPEESSVSLQRMGVLFTLYYKKDQSLKELAHLLAVSTSNLSVMIESMVQEELINRAQDENDRRKVVLNLSEKGEKMFKKEKEKMIGKLSIWLDNLSDKEMDQFIKSCNFINKQLSDF